MVYCMLYVMVYIIWYIVWYIARYIPDFYGIYHVIYHDTYQVVYTNWYIPVWCGIYHQKVVYTMRQPSSSKGGWERDQRGRGQRGRVGGNRAAIRELRRRSWVGCIWGRHGRSAGDILWMSSQLMNSSHFSFFAASKNQLKASSPAFEMSVMRAWAKPFWGRPLGRLVQIHPESSFLGIRFLWSIRARCPAQPNRRRAR